MVGGVGGVLRDFSFFSIILELMCVSYVLFWQNRSALPELVFGVVLVDANSLLPSSSGQDYIES
jgi:hypothetical protein